MGKREEALILLKLGHDPVEIRRRQGVSLNTILAYLDQMVGAGRIRRSDILYSVPPEIRSAAFEAVQDNLDPETAYPQDIEEWLRDKAMDIDAADFSQYVEIVLQYYDERYALGDMYEYVRSVEVGLHELIRKALEDEFGSEESGWWRRGVPLPIRQKCQSRREEDDDPLTEAYGYTDLLDLRSICDKQWTVVARTLPGDAASNKKQLSEELLNLNRIRRMVMHPTRGTLPTENDFDFLRHLAHSLGFMDESDAAFHSHRRVHAKGDTK